MGTDSLYYIMDYSGNYYRTNKSDQLVAAAGKDEATVFNFAQANSHVGVGRKAAFYCVVPIEDEKVPSVTTVLHLSDKEASYVQEEKKQEHLSPVKELAYDELPDEIEKKAMTYDLSEMDWAEYLTHFTYVASGINAYREDLAKRHSDTEQKICDIMHFIEFCDMTEEEAVDLVELLRVCRENRREIKDELQRIEYFQSNLGTSANIAKAKQALKSIKGLETRKYTPRKYEELFENCTLKAGRLKKSDIKEKNMDEQSVGEKNMQVYIRKHIQNDKSAEYGEGEEVIMRGEKYDTPFDGRENDWLAFARQQADFYRNAGQYIRNLQIAVNEINQEIETILIGTEEANCNVAQGYKVFKRLKELRLERKTKLQELECLYALTDYIDCEALADTCEDNLTEIETILNVKNSSEITMIQSVEEDSRVESMQDMVG